MGGDGVPPTYVYADKNVDEAIAEGATATGVRKALQFNNCGPSYSSSNSTFYFYQVTYSCTCVFVVRKVDRLATRTKER